MTTDDLVKINKDAFIQAGTIALTGVISSVFPFMMAPPFNLVEQEIAHLIAKEMAEKAELGAFFIYTDFRVDEQGGTYVASAHAADKEPDPVKAEQLRAIADAKFKDFFKINR